MKRSNATTRCVLVLMALSGLATFSASVFGRGQEAALSQNEQAARGIQILDQNGRPDPGVQPSATSQVVDVSVGPAANRVFAPSTVNISVGDTVKWTWASSNHSVTSGAPCTADSQFCSTNDMNCPAGALSNTGTVYQHTFGQAGTYFYFCALHCGSGMVGTVNVAPPCTAPPPDMVAWYPGDDNVRDIAGGNNGLLQNGATFAPGKVGQAFSLNGTGAFVSIPHRNDLNPTGPFSVDVWVKAETPQGENQSLIIDKSHGWIDSTGWGIQTNPDGTACFFYGTGGSGTLDFHGTCTLASILDAQWHHIAGVWTGTEIKIYKDGVFQSMLPFTTPPANNMREVHIGMSWGGGTPRRFFHGLIDEAEYFNRALSEPEIQAIFAADSAGKCKPPQPTAAFSRKTHGAAGPFDIDLMPFSTAGVECRSGGASGIYQMIVQFANPVTVTSASLIGGSGSVSGFSVSGAMVTVDLMNITNVQRVFMKLSGVNDGVLSGDVPVAMSMLVGDTTGNGAVSSSDVSQAKLQSGQPVSGTNFRNDIIANGSINASDVSSVKLSSGTALPQ